MIELCADIKGNGPPTKDTPGAIGQIYVDRETGITYECVEAFVQKGYKIDKAVYTWKEKGVDMSSVVTEATVEDVVSDAIDDAIDDLRDEIANGTVVPSGGVSIWAEIID